MGHTHLNRGRGCRCGRWRRAPRWVSGSAGSNPAPRAGCEWAGRGLGALPDQLQQLHRQPAGLTALVGEVVGGYSSVRYSSLPSSACAVPRHDNSSRQPQNLILMGIPWRSAGDPSCPSVGKKPDIASSYQRALVFPTGFSCSSRSPTSSALPLSCRRNSP